MTLTAVVTLVKEGELIEISRVEREVDNKTEPWYSETKLTESSYVINEGTIIGGLLS